MATRGQERPIDRSSPMPFYHQLQEILKEDLENGRWKPGDLIPSEGELASTYQVSRTVIRKSLDILEGDGRVIRVKGKGTLVAALKFQYETAADPSLWKKRWTTLPRLSRLLDVRRVAVGTRLGKLLDLGSASEVLEITFTHSIEPHQGQSRNAKLQSKPIPAPTASVPLERRPASRSPGGRCSSSSRPLLPPRGRPRQRLTPEPSGRTLFPGSGLATTHCRSR